MDLRFRTLETSDPRFETEDIREVTVKSAALGGRADLSLHAPAAARQQAHVPLVILLHGVYGSHWSWMRQAGAHRIAAELQRQGQIPPVVLATPSDGLWGDGSGYLPHHGRDFERWIAFEVPAAASQAIPAITSRSPLFIGGLSMGGFGALRLAARHPNRFAAAAALSAITDLCQLQALTEECLDLSEGDEGGPSSLAALLCANQARLPPFRFECGTEDTLLAANRSLHHSLSEASVPHTYEEFPGGHDWNYWKSRLPTTLRFFARFM